MFCKQRTRPVRRLNRPQGAGLVDSRRGAGRRLRAWHRVRHVSKNSNDIRRGGSPRTGGVLTARQTSDPNDFDPTGKPTNNRSVMCQCYDSLLSFKATPDNPYNDVVLQPGLAEKWEAPDGVTFTFHLRKGVQFHDLKPVNGREVTSADLKWSMEYISRSGQFKGDKKLFPALYSDSFQGLASIETPDPYTVVYKFTDPLAPFLNYCAAEWNPVLAHEIYEQDGNFSKTLVGTGPFAAGIPPHRKTASAASIAVTPTISLRAFPTWTRPTRSTSRTTQPRWRPSKPSSSTCWNRAPSPGTAARTRSNVSFRTPSSSPT